MAFNMLSKLCSICSLFTVFIMNAMKWFLATTLTFWNKSHIDTMCNPLNLLDLVCWCFVEDFKVFSFLNGMKSVRIVL